MSEHNMSTHADARGIDSHEGVETGTGSTAKPQEPGGEATRPEPVPLPKRLELGEEVKRLAVEHAKAAIRCSFSVEKTTIDALTEAETAVKAAIDRLVAAAPEQGVEAIAWPKQKCVGRIGDMAPADRTHMRVMLDNDNDVIVDVWQHDENEEYGRSCAIEFCNGGGGGGGSPRTRMALVALMFAMEADNAERATASKQFPPKRAAVQQGEPKP